MDSKQKTLNFWFDFFDFLLEMWFMGKLMFEDRIKF